MPASLEVGLVPRMIDGQFPGLFLFTTPSRMMRPVHNMATGTQELIGSFEQVGVATCGRDNRWVWHHVGVAPCGRGTMWAWHHVGVATCGRGTVYTCMTVRVYRGCRCTWILLLLLKKPTKE